MKKRIYPLLIFLLLAALLVLFIRDFVRQVILEPVLYVGWLVALWLASIPETVLWAIFVIVALFIAARSLAGGRRPPPLPEMPAASSQGPVATWLVLLERARNHTFSKWRLAQDLKLLTLETRSSASVDLDVTAEGQPALPPAIEAYFDARLPMAERVRLRWPFSRMDPQRKALQLDPEVVVRYLEERS